MPKIDVQAEQTPTGLVARIIGEASVEQIDELDRELNFLAVLAPKLVVLDLTGVPYVSSMAIGSLLRFRNEISSSGGKVVVCGLQKSVADTFRLANLDRVLPVHANAQAALSAAAAT